MNLMYYSQNKLMDNPSNFLHTRSSEYLKKTEKLVKRFSSLKNNIFGWKTESSRNEAAEKLMKCSHYYMKNYQVIGILSNIIVAFDSHAKETVAIKVIEKQINEKDNPIILPLNVPFMVPLIRYHETDTSIYLILKFISGGKLFNHTKKFMKRSSYSNALNTSSSPYKYSAQRLIPEDHNLDKNNGFVPENYSLDKSRLIPEDHNLCKNNCLIPDDRNLDKNSRFIPEDHNLDKNNKPTVKVGLLPNNKVLSSSTSPDNEINVSSVSSLNEVSVSPSAKCLSKNFKKCVEENKIQSDDFKFLATENELKNMALNPIKCSTPKTEKLKHEQNSKRIPDQFDNSIEIVRNFQCSQENLLPTSKFESDIFVPETQSCVENLGKELIKIDNSYYQTSLTNVSLVAGYHFQERKCSACLYRTISADNILNLNLKANMENNYKSISYAKSLIDLRFVHNISAINLKKSVTFNFDKKNADAISIGSNTLSGISECSSRNFDEREDKFKLNSRPHEDQFKLSSGPEEDKFKSSTSCQENKSDSGSQEMWLKQEKIKNTFVDLKNSKNNIPIQDSGGCHNDLSRINFDSQVATLIKNSKELLENVNKTLLNSKTQLKISKTSMELRNSNNFKNSADVTLSPVILNYSQSPSTFFSSSLNPGSTNNTSQLIPLPHTISSTKKVEIAPYANFIEHKSAPICNGSSHSFINSINNSSHVVDTKNKICEVSAKKLLVLNTVNGDEDFLLPINEDLSHKNKSNLEIQNDNENSVSKIKNKLLTDYNYCDFTSSYSGSTSREEKIKYKEENSNNIETFLCNSEAKNNYNENVCTNNLANLLQKEENINDTLPEFSTKNEFINSSSILEAFECSIKSKSESLNDTFNNLKSCECNLDTLLESHIPEGLVNLKDTLSESYIQENLVNVSDNLPEAESHIPEGLVRAWIMQIIVAMDNLHQQAVIWTDFNPNNVLLDEGGSILLTFCHSYTNSAIFCPKKVYYAYEDYFFNDTFSISRSLTNDNSQDVSFLDFDSFTADSAALNHTGLKYDSSSTCLNSADYLNDSGLSVEFKRNQSKAFSCLSNSIKNNSGFTLKQNTLINNSVLDAKSTILKDNWILSMGYIAPELFNPLSKITPLVDWWSVGALMYHLLSGKDLASSHPYGLTSRTTLQLPKHLSEEAASLITNLLSYNSTERLGSSCVGVQEIKDHPFFFGMQWP